MDISQSIELFVQKAGLCNSRLIKVSEKIYMLEGAEGKRVIAVLEHEMYKNKATVHLYVRPLPIQATVSDNKDVSFHIEFTDPRFVLTITVSPEGEMDGKMKFRSDNRYDRTPDPKHAMIRFENKTLGWFPRNL